MPEVINAKTTPSDRVVSLITETPLAELYEFVSISTAATVIVIIPY
jgi:hypothetical protein